MVFLCITNNSIKYKSFVYTQLKDQRVLFLAIQFSINHLFALSLNVKKFYLTYRPVLLLRGRMDLGAMVMKGYSVLSKTHALQEPRHQIVYCQVEVRVE